MATHGIKTGVKWNTFDISSYLDKASLERMIDLVETTVFGGSAKSKVAGLPDAKVGVSGPYDGNLEATAGMETDWQNGQARVIKIQVDRTINASTTNPSYSFTALISNFKMNSGINDKWTWSGDIEISSGAITRGTAGPF